MKKLLLFALAACLPFSMALAQMPDPANFHIVFGNVDGSALTVGVDKDIQIPVWGATDATPANPDSVNFMHVPLMSDDLIISARAGGFFPAFGVGLWDDRSFLTPNAHDTVWTSPPHVPPALVIGDTLIPVGFMSQSFLGFAYLTDPRDEQNFIYTLGAYQLLGTFRMHTINNPALIGSTVNPFSQGHNPANAGLLWGMQDGVRNVVPTQVYCALFFSPNAAPVWTSPTTITLPPYGCIPLAGTDTDTDNTLTITGPGGVIATGTGGAISGTYCADFVDGQVVVFDLFDGTDHIPLSVTVTVTCGDPETAVTALSMPHCAAGIPGSIADVAITLNTNICIGGFEILINTDNTALNLVGIEWLPAINAGSEYHNWIQDPLGAGSDRFVWIADVNDGVDGPPMYWGLADSRIILLHFAVTPGLPWGMEIPVDFITEGPGDYTSNTVSDETGNWFIHPQLTNGCVMTVNPETFKGDPNLNCWFYEVADAVLVARRLIEGTAVWLEDDGFGQSPHCSFDTHYVGNDALQEAGADLNGNGHADIADLVRFINILNGFITPKLDPAVGSAAINMVNGVVSINSGVEVGGALVRIAHNGTIGTPVAANGMELLSNDANGVLSVVVYSLAGNRIPAGEQTLFTVTGTGTVSEASAADAYGRLLESRVGAPVPTQFAVSQNYPNPFNAKTLIKFSLTDASDVTVAIYSITGQLVETLNGRFGSGDNQITWDASHVASGVYFAKVSAGSNSQTMKMTLLK